MKFEDLEKQYGKKSNVVEKPKETAEKPSVSPEEVAQKEQAKEAVRATEEVKIADLREDIAGKFDTTEPVVVAKVEAPVKVDREKSEAEKSQEAYEKAKAGIFEAHKLLSSINFYSDLDWKKEGPEVSRRLKELGYDFEYNPKYIDTKKMDELIPLLASNLADLQKKNGMPLLSEKLDKQREYEKGNIVKINPSELKVGDVLVSEDKRSIPSKSYIKITEIMPKDPTSKRTTIYGKTELGSSVSTFVSHYEGAMVDVIR